MPEPRALTRHLGRAWGLVPVALIALVLALRAGCHVEPLDRLAPAASDPRDPMHTRAYAGSIAIARGGPVVIGFQSAAPARVTFAGHELVGTGLVKERIVVPHGATALRFAAPRGARLVWSPVGRRGDPEYVSASALAPEPPDRAVFAHPGTANTDGLCALALLAIVVGTALVLARRRLARADRRLYAAMGAVLALALAARLIGLGDAGQTWDEDVNWAAGRNDVTNVLARDFTDASWSWNYEHPPVMKLLDGIGAQLADGFGPARALSALWLALGCALLVPIGERLYNRRVGVLSGIIAALLPPLVAHGQIVGHESPTVLWWALGILLALGIHDEVPPDPALADPRAHRQVLARLAAVGVVIGIAIASRFVNGLLGPLGLAIAVIVAPPAWRRITLLRASIVMPIVALVTVYVIWPRLWGHPIVALRASLAKLTGLHSPEPFLGATTNQPGSHYFLAYLVATLPLLVALAVVAYIVRAARERDRAAIVVVACFVIPLGVALSPVRQDGVRYVMPCLLAFALAAAAGLDHLATRPALARFPRGFHALAGALALYLGITLALQRPYYLDYFAEQVGGPGTVMRHRWFETAWWGEGLDRALDYVNARAAPDDLVVRCIEPGHLAWFREDLWAPSPTPAAARWFVVYAPASHGCPIPADARLVYANTSRGVTYARVYER